jgi:TolB-like protein
MRRIICVAAVLLFTITGALFAQTRKDNVVGKDNLAILPFTGGAGDEGDAIAELLSYDPDLIARFGIIPRTGIADAIKKEQGFQTTSSMTNADTIAALGAQLGAKYVMAGNITALGNQKLVVVTIVRIETIQQVAGDFLTYTEIDELPARFPGMMKTLLPLLDVNTSGLPKLAVLPVQMEGDATNQRDADTLAQILAIYLLRNKGYAIYPRTSSLETVQQEFKTQQSGVTADRNAAQSGYGVNPEYVLSVTSRKLGEMNMFIAAIIDMAAGTQLQGIQENYWTLSDGISAMRLIAKSLSGGKISAKEQSDHDKVVSSSASAENRAENRVEDERIAAERLDKFLRTSGIIIGLQGGLSLTSGVDTQILGEPEPTKPSSDDGDDYVYVDNQSGNVGIVAALRLGKIFVIQSGLNFNISYKGPSKLEYTYLQVPVLLRVDWNWPLIDGKPALWMIPSSVFGGIAFNSPMSASSTVSFSVRANGPTQTATMVIPISYIFGFGVKGNISNLSIYADLQWVDDFSETTVTLADGHTGSFNRSSSNFIFGMKYYIPFRR